MTKPRGAQKLSKTMRSTMGGDVHSSVEAREVQSSSRGVQRNSGIALWRQIAEDIEAEIETGRLTTGNRLPTEAELATHFAVNRHTVRRAISELAQKGLVEAAPGRGTFVRASRLAYPIGQMTRFSEAIIRSGREPSGTLINHNRIVVPGGVQFGLQLTGTDEVIELDHLRAADRMPICLATAWFPADRFDGIGEAFAATGSITQSLATFGIHDYRRAKTLISSRTANARERESLELEHGANVLVVDSINVDMTNTPFQVAHSRFAAERVQLVVDNDEPGLRI